MLVTSNAKVEEVSKEIRRYEAVTEAKINREKSVGLQLGSWKGSSQPLQLEGRSMQDIRRLVLGLIFNWKKIGRKYWKRL